MIAKLCIYDTEREIAEKDSSQLPRTLVEFIIEFIKTTPNEPNFATKLKLNQLTAAVCLTFLMRRSRPSIIGGFSLLDTTEEL